MAYQNFYATKLTNDINDTQDTITLNSPPTVYPGNLVINARNASQREIISYTAIAGSTVTGVSRGQQGTTARSHIGGTIVEMNATAEDFTDALNTPNDIRLRAADTIEDFIAEGLVWSQTSGLTGEMTAGVAYINGYRVVMDAVASYVFPTSKDIYIDLDYGGTLYYEDETNGAAQPALNAVRLRIAKVVTDGSGITSVTNFAIPAAHLSGWNVLRNPSTGDYAVPDTITNNGNRSYDLVFNGLDYTPYLSEGTRLKIGRSVKAPTQSTSLNGTTQYWSKSSPTGVTFTSTYSATGWVYPTSFTTAGAIIGRDSAAANLSGWEFGINSNGQVNIYARNGTGAIIGTSAQSVPLNKWSHVAGTLNAATGTVLIYIDGILVPSTTTGSATTIVQATTDLTIGKRNGAANYFAGKLAQVSLHSSIISASDVRASMSQTLTGSETGSISAFSFNGVATDLNLGSANNLTAAASAGYTSDSPFANGSRSYDAAGTTDYAVVSTKPVFSTNTTVTVQVPEGCTIPTSGGINAVAYSTQRVPYGFPLDMDRWAIVALYKANTGAIAIGSVNNWFIASSRAITVPVGSYSLSYSVGFFLASTVSGVRDGFLTLASSLPTAGLKNQELTVQNYNGGTPNSIIQAYKEASVSLSSATTYNLYASIVTATGIETFYIRDDAGAGILKATPNFL